MKDQLDDWITRGRDKVKNRIDALEVKIERLQNETRMEGEDMIPRSTKDIHTEIKRSKREKAFLEEELAVIDGTAAHPWLARLQLLLKYES